MHLFDHWIMDSAVSASLVLMAGFTSMLLIRQPQRNQRLGEIAVAGAMVAVLISAIPGTHIFFLRCFPAHNSVRPEIANSSFHIGLPGQSAVQTRAGGGAARNAVSAKHTTMAFWRRYDFNWPDIFGAAYLFGVLAMICRLVTGCLLLQRTAARATVLRYGHLPLPINSYRTPWPWSKSVVIRVSERIPAPAAFGIFRPVILLPKTVADADQETLSIALTHEMAHITRGDTISRMIAAMAATLLFYNPLFWVLLHRIRLSQEFLADQTAAGAARSHCSYIELMLKMAKTVRSRETRFIPAAGLIGGKSDFYLRMNRLLEHRRENIDSPDNSRRWFVCALGGMTLVTLPASMLTLGTPPQHSGLRQADRDIRIHAHRLVERGLAYLGRKQSADGAWLGRYGPAVTALAVRGYIEAGASESNRHVLAGLQFIENSRHADGGFYGNMEPAYNTAIVLRTLSMLPEQMYQQQARRGLVFLHQQLRRPTRQNSAATRWFDGPSMFNAEPAGQSWLLTGENGNSARDQISAGLWMSSNTLDPTERSGNTILTQYGQITYAQLKSMIYAGLSQDDPRVLRLSRWISGHYTLAYNPAENSSLGVYYYFVVFAQTMRARGRQWITDSSGLRHNWRRDLVQALARRMRTNGSWVNTGNGAWLEGNPIMATTYTVLALDQVTR